MTQYTRANAEALLSVVTAQTKLPLAAHSIRARQQVS